MDILDRIVNLLNDRNQKELCDYLKLDKSAVTSWKNGSSKSYRKYLIEIAEFFDVSIDYLVYGRERSQPLPDDELELLTYYKELPDREQQRLIGRASALAEVYKEQAEVMKDKSQITMTTIKIADVAAGAGISTPFTIDNAFSLKEIPSDAVISGADCGVPINGDSMEPNYPNGSIVWVKITQDVGYGDVVIAILNGEPYCKIYQPDGLHSLNENYEVIHVGEQDNFSIFGKVIGYYET